MLPSNNSQYPTTHRLYGPVCAELMEFCCITGLLVFQTEKIIANTQEIGRHLLSRVRQKHLTLILWQLFTEISINT